MRIAVLTCGAVQVLMGVAGTFYAPGLGACGLTNSASDHIAAVSHQFFDSYECVLVPPSQHPPWRADTTPQRRQREPEQEQDLRQDRDRALYASPLLLLSAEHGADASIWARAAGGKSVTVKIVDRCGGCKGPTDLDMSPSAFDVLAPESKGRIPITWTLN